ncbi:hypothetical protein HBH56_209950 [Parastagonospora nodorum]|nr:hypothetical protein HBH56_209950 [Parastagonospora nodorum]KAH3931404.1 hypothetical protein HBH54_098560 [Parastagonospora nodorum]KAH4128379.1 hypothetical protein HBH45_211950 [Parastagonospora nodorum]KAH4147264.1 hypothetical protein HBH44_227640 [Parastagonospora nodorum]KAH4217313.1 hypothetical protein HBI06_215170 [Parastagonospora nodorum]
MLNGFAESFVVAPTALSCTMEGKPRRTNDDIRNTRECVTDHTNTTPMRTLRDVPHTSRVQRFPLADSVR